MKTIKTLLTSLFLFVGLTAQAQVIVIEKTDGTKDEYQLYEVDSVAYVPQTYYYYVGWECPTSLSELANKVASADNVHSYGITKTTNIGFNSYNPFAKMNVTLTDEEWVEAHEYQTRNQYVIVPSGMKLYDADDITCEITTYHKDTSVQQIPNHDIYKSRDKIANSAKFACY